MEYRGSWWLAQYRSRSFRVNGPGTPGPLTRKLRDLYWASHQDPRYSTAVRY